MENYEKWSVWKLEDRLEEISKQRDALRQEARHITAIRDVKLSRGETQERPLQAMANTIKANTGFLERIGLRKKRGPDQAIKVGG